MPLFSVWYALHRRSGHTLLQTAEPLLPGIAAGLYIAMMLGLYNYIRFGNFLEFGHNYLPEFSTQGGVQFSLQHVLHHLKTFVWGLPLSKGLDGVWRLCTFGYSAFLACPVLLLMLCWFGTDCWKKRLRWEKAVVLGAFLLHFFGLLLHRTFGGYQLGARYTVDLMPYAFFYLLLTPEKRRLHPAEWAFLTAALLFTCWGVSQVHL